jgi:hypothetical protein
LAGLYFLRLFVPFRGNYLSWKRANPLANLPKPANLSSLCISTISNPV